MINKKWLYIFIISLIIFVIMTIKERIYDNSSAPISLDAEYLNQDLFMSSTFVDEVISSIKFGEDGAVCLYTTSNSLEIVYLEKTKSGYSCSVRHGIDTELLTEDFKSYNDITPIIGRVKKNIYYNVFLNPQIDEITVNGTALPVNKVTVDICGTKYDLGFWSLALPSGTDVLIDG
ncbi:MAG: hypothetical protein E7267_02720 [Lachnospiraceae bacterium]|nr:hypothetical protein [Lachnospiraceae bacterium]